MLKIRQTALLALLLGIVEWVNPLVAQAIEPNVPIRPHESESVANLTGRSPDFDDDPGVRSAQIKGVRGDLISMQRVAHKPSRAARKDFDRGIRAMQTGRRSQAIQYLAAATRSDPDYFEAHAYLGQLFLQEGEPLRGLAHLERALVIDPNSDVVESNKAWALLALRRSVEAEQAGRRAVRLAPASQIAHYVLGLALLQQSRATAETATHLEIAARKYPDAQPGLAWVRGRLASQKVELDSAK